MVSKIKQLKILLVEDEPIAAAVNRKILEEMGYKPGIATNGKQAIEMSAQHYDIIFMDIGLPDIDGITATAKIRQREGKDQKRACIVAITAYCLGEVRDQCIKAGMDDVAAKPISTEQLQRIIDQRVLVNV